MWQACSHWAAAALGIFYDYDVRILALASGPPEMRLARGEAAFSWWTGLLERSYRIREDESVTVQYRLTYFSIKSFEL